jgi:dimethylaniline monooxygenase (N-oxide forming)
MHFIPDSSREYARISEQTVRPDVVIFATGYTQKFPFLPQTPTGDDIDQQPYATPQTATVRSLFAPSDPSVAFIGFVRPGLGAIPPLAELQAMLWISILLGSVDPSTLSPEDEWHTRIVPHPVSVDGRLPRTVNYAVEHESYAWQLGKDMGSAPSASDILHLAAGEFSKGRHGLADHRAWYRLPIVWAAGANVVTKFRLVGPWKWDGAPEIMTGEMWETVSRRKGVYGENLSSGLILISSILTARQETSTRL